jgi:hypothetical protein
MLSLLPDDIRDRFDLVGFDPRGVGLSTPALWCNSDEDNDRLRADNVVAYTPEGVAHIDGQTKEFIQRCVDKMGKDSWRTSAPSTSPRISTRSGRASATTS